MKFLILLSTLLFSLNSFSCGTGSHVEIDSCTVEDKFFEIFEATYPNHTSMNLEDYTSSTSTDKYMFSEQIYINDLPTLTRFEMLVMPSKPAQSVFDEALSAMKVSMKSDFDFKVSVDSMDRFRDRMVKCDYNQPNPALLKRDILNQKDTVRRDCLVSKTAELDAEQVQRDIKDAVIKDKAFSDDLAVDFIVLMRTGVKDVPRNKRLLSKLAVVLALLGAGDIEGGRDELLAVPADADFSQGVKDAFVVKLNTYIAL